MEENDACGGLGGGVEGDEPAGDGSGGCPGTTEGHGAECEGLEVVGGAAGEGGGVGVGDVLFEDVDAEEERPERVQVRGCVEGPGCL